MKKIKRTVTEGVIRTHFHNGDIEVLHSPTFTPEVAKSIEEFESVDYTEFGYADIHYEMRTEFFLKHAICIDDVFAPDFKIRPSKEGDETC